MTRASHADSPTIVLWKVPFQANDKFWHIRAGDFGGPERAETQGVAGPIVDVPFDNWNFGDACPQLLAYGEKIVWAA